MWYKWEGTYTTVMGFPSSLTVRINRRNKFRLNLTGNASAWQFSSKSGQITVEFLQHQLRRVHVISVAKVSCVFVGICNEEETVRHHFATRCSSHKRLSCWQTDLWWRRWRDSEGQCCQSVWDVPGSPSPSHRRGALRGKHRNVTTRTTACYVITKGGTRLSTCPSHPPSRKCHTFILIHKQVHNLCIFTWI